METNKRDVGWKLWAQWVLANIIGIAVATRLSIDFHNSGSGTIDHAIMGIIGIILYGFIIGIAQWLVLFRFDISAWWILATEVGILAFLMLYSSISLLGAAIVQFPILWRRVRWSGLWILAHVPAYFLITRKYQTLHYAVSSSIISPFFETRFIVLMIIGTINSVITGFVLIWLLRHPKTVVEADV
jgi:hypothetical protein